MILEDEWVTISGLSSFLFCRRRWALENIESLWQDNVDTIVGSHLHEKAHDTSKRESRGDLIISRGLRVFSSSLGISGACDVVEFHRSDSGISLHGKEGLWSVFPVEYKKGSGSNVEIDSAQLCCQAMCLEEMLCCDIKEGALFYHGVKGRTLVSFDASLRDRVRSSISEMHDLWQKKYTPVVKYRSLCRQCSLFDLCVPKLKTGGNISDYIHAHIEEDII